jgi:tRNA pseudouridine55 synthase
VIESGLLLVDKPADWTSHDVVAKLRGVLGTRKIGHAGTLDPMATGLLLLGVNAGTKLLTYLVGADKTYTTTIRLGQATTTDDAEGELAGTAADATGLSVEQIDAAVQKLTGNIMQVPSSVSAIKVDGQRAYALVRGGAEVKLAARPVVISRFERTGEVRGAEGNCIEFEAIIDCSSGTYIRALARDLGENLGVGGHLRALRRTRIASYTLETATALDKVTPDAVTDLSEAAAAAFDARNLTAAEVTDLRHGKRIAAAGFAGDYAGFDDSGVLVAMLTDAGKQAKSTVVFANA